MDFDKKEFEAMDREFCDRLGALIGSPVHGYALVIAIGDAERPQIFSTSSTGYNLLAREMTAELRSLADLIEAEGRHFDPPASSPPR